MRKVSTLRFGEIEVDEKKILHFKDGIPAFEDEHEFIVVPYDKESPYGFMQSLNTPDLAFLITSPFVFFPEYEFELDDESEEKLELKHEAEMEIYTLITIPGGKVADMTANLMAPIVVNTTNMQARQIVLDKSPYNTKHRLFPAKKEEN